MKPGRYDWYVVFSVWVLGLMSAFSPAQDLPAAKPAGFADKGTLRILQSGKEIGKESFQIVAENGGWKCTADIKLNPPGQDPIQVHTETSLNEKGLFRSYDAERTGGGPQAHLRVFMEDGIAICEEKGKISSESTPVKVNPDFQILDTNVFHHYSLLAARMAMGPQIEQLQVLIPQEAIAGTVSIKNAAKEVLKIGRNKITANRYDLDSGELKLTLWIDDAGKLYKIRVPQTDAEVTRVD